MRGKDLIEFVTTNKLEEVKFEYLNEYKQIQFTVEIDDTMWIEYVIYLDDGDWNITQVELINGVEEFGYIEPKYALKLRGLAE